MTDESSRLPRHLAAILYADVAGFSRMTEQDEETAYRSVRSRLDRFAANIQADGGEVMNYSGDAVLARFSSAEDALICAARVQQEFSELNKSLPDDQKIVFRIGLHLGDIIEDRGDIFGNGVNVAARLEGLGEPGGICISGTFHDAVVGKLPFEFNYLGEQQVKNISRPIPAYHASLSEGATLPSARGKPGRITSPIVRYAIVAATAALAIVVGIIAWPTGYEEKSSEPTVAQATTDDLSIVVLPFDDISEKKDQGFFVDGMTEDIITDLSRLAKIKVMARNTSFRYKGQSVKPQQIAKELNVRYMLEGSVRKAGDTIRVNAQLIDTRNGYHLWADRFDRKITDLFKVQDEVTHKIVESLSVQLSAQEESNITQVQTNNIEAYEAYLRGWQFYVQRTKESNLSAQDEFKKAIKLDPNYARAYGGLALATSVSITAGWTDSPVVARSHALDLANKAVELDPNLPQAHWIKGFVQLFRNDYDDARKSVEQSLKLAPSYADAYGLLALINNRLGRGEEAIKLIKKGMSLNPYYTWDYPYNLGRGYYNLGEFQQAVTQLKLALERNPNALQPRLFLAASYAGLNMQDEAEWAIYQAQTTSPDISLAQVHKTMAIVDKKIMKRFTDHLGKAGLQ